MQGPDRQITQARKDRCKIGWIFHAFQDQDRLVLPNDPSGPRQRLQLVSLYVELYNRYNPVLRNRIIQLYNCDLDALARKSTGDFS